MATKYFCDGCDKEVPYANVRRVDVALKTKGEAAQSGGDYDLCQRCVDRLGSEANPKNWPRDARSKTATAPFGQAL